jgi:hypothetical protein
MSIETGETNNPDHNKQNRFTCKLSCTHTRVYTSRPQLHDMVLCTSCPEDSPASEIVSIKGRAK